MHVVAIARVSYRGELPTFMGRDWACRESHTGHDHLVGVQLCGGVSVSHSPFVNDIVAIAVKSKEEPLTNASRGACFCSLAPRDENTKWGTR